MISIEDGESPRLFSAEDLEKIDCLAGNTCQIIDFFQPRCRHVMDECHLFAGWGLTGVQVRYIFKPA